jgi:hypothetical protein
MASRIKAAAERAGAALAEYRERELLYEMGVLKPEPAEWFDPTAFMLREVTNAMGRAVDNAFLNGVVT